ncbi:MAG: hypothetical protein ABI604_03150 [Nitrospirota bacterium]
MFTEFQQPAYLHLLINHLPIIGTGVGLLGLIVGLLLRHPLALIPALIILLFSGLSAWPVYVTGSSAYKPIHKIADEAGVNWLDEHMDRADNTVWVFYVMAGFAALSLTVPLKWPKSVKPLAILVLVSAIGSLGVGGYIAQAGGRIRHTELRPPANELH